MALLAGLILLLLPAVALAQSAGDNEYNDPFAKQAPASNTPTSSPGSSAPDNSQTADANSQSASTPSSSSDPAAASSGDGALPRTGSRIWILGLLGGLMLLSGTFLRLGLRPLPQRAGGGIPLTLGRDVRLTYRSGR
ncbi:MAG TPA: hypothetical protein VGF21_06950 [Thermoleophilaceae bacterium]